MADDFLIQVRAAIERRVREQLARHMSVEPNIDHGQIIDIQMRQERERLERQALEYEDAGKDRLAELMHTLIEDWLPELTQELKRR